VHPTDGGQSVVIASDKKANRLFVYDLDGKVVHSVAARHPGNIDVRYGFPLNGARVDIVALNQRDDPRVLVYKIDPATRRLERIDNDAITTSENYGGTLFRSPKTGQFYFFTTSKMSDIEQYELADDGAGKVAGKKVRSWRISKSESAVADDEAGAVYFGEEERGIWRVGGEPDDPTPGELVIQRGEHGLDGDVEGLALYTLPGGDGYLIVSNQKDSNFKVYRRGRDHAYLGTFAVEGVKATDGIEVCNAALGPRFPNGLFACHSDPAPCPVFLTPWDKIAAALKPSLKVDTSWKRRNVGKPDAR
jgi:3-phytase